MNYPSRFIDGKCSTCGWDGVQQFGQDVSICDGCASDVERIITDGLNQLAKEWRTALMQPRNVRTLGPEGVTMADFEPWNEK